jgi:hypothetical protein
MGIPSDGRKMGKSHIEFPNPEKFPSRAKTTLGISHSLTFSKSRPDFMGRESHPEFPWENPLPKVSLGITH